MSDHPFQFSCSDWNSNQCFHCDWKWSLCEQLLICHAHCLNSVNLINLTYTYPSCQSRWQCMLHCWYNLLNPTAMLPNFLSQIYVYLIPGLELEIPCQRQIPLPSSAGNSAVNTKLSSLRVCCSLNFCVVFSLCFCHLRWVGNVFAYVGLFVRPWTKLWTKFSSDFRETLWD